MARAGRQALHDLLRNNAAPTIEDSTREGRAFAEKLGLVSPKAAALMDALGPEVPSSIAMLGDSVFALGDRGLRASVRSAARGAFIRATRVATQGARLL